MKIIDSYLDHLAANPERIDSILQWTFCTTFVWIVLLIYRERILTGLEGKNMLFESGEVIAFTAILCFVPTQFHILFFKGTETHQWWALLVECGLFASTLYGRYIFDWALAFKSGADHVNVTVIDAPKDLGIKTVTNEVTAKTTTTEEQPK